MKKIFLLFSMTLLIGHFVKAQNHNTLWCDKNLKLKDSHYLSRQAGAEAGKINLLVKWGAPNGGATLSKENILITNGACETCKPLGAIGSGNYQQTWVIKVTDPAKPVTISWNTRWARSFDRAFVFRGSPN